MPGPAAELEAVRLVESEPNPVIGPAVDELGEGAAEPAALVS